MVESEETHINNKPWMRSEESCGDKNELLSEELNPFSCLNHSNKNIPGRCKGEGDGSC
ncbi:hypothetical protein SOVF_051750 [Spinacia oleracea]|nr:hypothetical protein SOVF_051750 [Spinacia oleracea]